MNDWLEDYPIYAFISPIMYVLFRLLTFGLGFSNPYAKESPFLWFLGGMVFFSLIGEIAYVFTFFVVGKYGCQSTGDLASAYRSVQHWLVRALFYFFTFFILDIVFSIVYFFDHLF